MAGKSIDERIVLIDAKIAKHQQEIIELTKTRERLLHPLSFRTVLEKAKEAGLTPQDMAERLGLDTFS